MFVENLEALKEPEGKKLANNIKKADSFFTTHEPAIKAYVDAISHENALEPLFNMLMTKRSEVFTSEISQNPRGQILEPGFRVNFPE